jgi:hypothetical protein
VLTILILAVWAFGGVAAWVNGTRRAIPAAGGFAAGLAIALIAWRREGVGGVLVVSGATIGMAVALSDNDPFQGYETMLGCVISACYIIPGALFLISWGLRATSPLPPLGQPLERASGSSARWSWIARATSLIALAYAIWILAMATLHRGTYGDPTYTFLCVSLGLSVFGCFTGERHPRIGSALLLLAAAGFWAALLRSHLQTWNGDRSLNFAALSLPLAVAALFQLAAAAQRPQPVVAATTSGGAT